MNAHAASSPSTPSSRLRRLGLAALVAVMAVTLLPAPSAQAYYNEGSQAPGTVQRSQGGGSVPGSQRRCGSVTDPTGSGPILWRREANGVWRVEAINYPVCTGTIGVVTNTSTNSTGEFDVDDPGFDWGNSGNHLYCVKYVEVLRFYGPRTNPAQYVTRSVAYPHVPCAQTGGFQAALSRFGFMAPHPHDAHRNPSGSFFQSTGTYATTRPLSQAWQPMGNFSTGTHCPRPDDTANLRRFFSTSWPTPEEAELARFFRQSMGATYSNLLSRVRAARLPDSVAATILNTTGPRRYSGDNFNSINYSDGMPCSSPLDFTVPHGQTPWVYGYCAAPVVAVYRGPLWTRQNGQIYYGVVEAFPDAWDTSPNRDGYKRHLPDYGVEAAQGYFAASGTSPAPADSIVRAYRNRAASILGRTDQFQFSVSPNVVGRASQMAASLPCAYGQGPVEPDQVVVEAREPVDPIAISGPTSELAYVGGARTAQTFTFRPSATITCRGGRACTQGQVIREVNYNPTISVPSGWTACGTSNRASCDYSWSWRRINNTTLEVTLRTYTATRPGQRIRVVPRGTVVVEWPQLQTDQGALSFSIAHTTSGFSSNLSLNTTISIPYGPGTTSTRANVSSSPVPMSVTVAGSRLSTER